MLKGYLAMPTVRFPDPDDRIAWRYGGYDQRSGSPDERLAFLKIFTKALSDAGIPILSGTDAPRCLRWCPASRYTRTFMRSNKTA